MKDPSSKGLELLNDLYELVFSGNINELAIQRIIHEAEKIKSEDPLNYYYIMGAASCVRNREEDMHNYYQEALDQFGNYALTHFNYAVSLHRLGYLFVAKEQVRKACVLSPTTEKYLEFYDRIHFELTNKQMWSEMETESEDEINQYFLHASESALAKTWDDPEEDEAWADL